jgi:hypothetical protein
VQENPDGRSLIFCFSGSHYGAEDGTVDRLPLEDWFSIDLFIGEATLSAILRRRHHTLFLASPC